MKTEVEKWSLFDILHYALTFFLFRVCVRLIPASQSASGLTHALVDLKNKIKASVRDNTVTVLNNTTWLVQLKTNDICALKKTVAFSLFFYLTIYGWICPRAIFFNSPDVVSSTTTIKLLAAGDTTAV